VGKTTLQASGILGQSNLALGPTTSTACSDTVGIGLVISSKPAAGAFVNSGDQITLTTSTGYCKIQVPSVIAESQSQATNILQVAHFHVTVSPTDPSTCSPSQVGTVTNESLDIGSHVPYDSTITISVCEASTEPTTTTTIATTTTTTS
jgi:serine/threonine-protein kinase